MSGPDRNTIWWAITSVGKSASQREMCNALRGQYSQLEVVKALYEQKQEGWVRVDGNSRYVPVAPEEWLAERLARLTERVDGLEERERKRGER